MIFLLNPLIFFHFEKQSLNIIHRRSMLEHHRVLWIILRKSRDIIQIIEKNLEQKHFFISTKNNFENICWKIFVDKFRKSNFQKSSESEKIWFPKFWFFQMLMIFENLVFGIFQKICFKEYFQMYFSSRWKNIFAPDFFLWFGLCL